MKKVLVVDDDENICKLCGNSLKNIGCKVITTNKPQNALDIINNEEIDLVLTDIKMPAVDGLEILRQVKETNPDIAVVVMTAYGSMEVAIKSVNNGAYSFIHKPFHVNELVLAVKNALERQRLIKDIIRLKTLVNIFNVSEQITNTLDISNVMDTVIKAVMNETNSKRAIVYYPDEETDELYVKFAIGLEENLKDSIRLPYMQGIAGNVFHTRKSVLINDIYSDEKVMAHPHELKLGNSVLAIPMQNKQDTLGVLTLFKNGSSKGFSESDKDIAAILTSQASIAIDNAELILDREILFLESMKSLAKTLDERDAYTHGHSHRVAKIAYAIGQFLQLSESHLEVIKHAGVLHDIGKIGIRDEILLKPGPLTSNEYEIIKTHPSKGYNILKNITRLSDVAEAVYCHHEWYNGNGYPRRLKYNEIPLEGSILAVADAYDTITTDRPYRKRQPHNKALEILRAFSKSQFHPDPVSAMEEIDVCKLNLY